MTRSSPQSGQLWPEDPHRFVAGPVRRALDHQVAEARAAGAVLSGAEVAAVRRLANDVDRLEAAASHAAVVKPWDFNPKTATTVAYLAALAHLFKAVTDDDDPFTRAVRELEDRDAAPAGTTAPLDGQGPVPPY